MEQTVKRLSSTVTVGTLSTQKQIVFCLESTTVWFLQLPVLNTALALRESEVDRLTWWWQDLLTYLMSMMPNICDIPDRMWARVECWSQSRTIAYWFWLPKNVWKSENTAMQLQTRLTKQDVIQALLFYPFVLKTHFMLIKGAF